MIWQIGKGFFKGIWQLIRTVIMIADTVLNEVPDPPKEHKLYSEMEAHDLFYQGKITVAEYIDCTED